MQMRRRTVRRTLEDFAQSARDTSPATILVALVIVLVVGSVGLAFAILIFPEVLAGTAKNSSDRIGLATFFIEFAAVSTIGLAAYEFWRSQRGPTLRIMLTAEERENPREVIYVGDANSHPSATFMFDMLLENAGPVAGRWIRVKVTATMLGGMQTARVVELRLAGESSVGNWEQVNNLSWAFLGNDGFIAYPRPRQTHRRFLPMHDWADNIGRFELICETRYEQMPWEETSGLAQINTSVWADRSSRFEQHFTLLLGQDPRD